MSTKLNIESIIDGSIEKGKLAESVQESLNKADNAMQSTDVETLLEDFVHKDDTINFANDLTGVVEATPEMFTYRPSAGDKSVRDESAVIRRIKGNTSVWGQIVNRKRPTVNTGYIITINDDGSVTIKRDPSIESGHYCALNMDRSYRNSSHKYMFTADVSLNGVQATSDYCGVSVYNLGVMEGNHINYRTNGRHFFCCFGTPDTTTSWQFAFYVYGVAEMTIHNLQCIDLTDLFSAGYEPTTYEGFRKYYPDKYYPYCTPEVRSMRATGIETIGFNQWDEEWENGRFDTGDGTNISNNQIRCKNLIKIFPNTYYSLSIGDNNLGIWAMFYDESQKILQPVNLNSRVNRNCLYISPSGNRNVFLTPENASWMKFYIPQEYGSTTYKGDICINLSHSGVRNGEYKPYEKNTLLLPEITKYFPNGMHGIGDVFDEIIDGLAIQRIGIVDLGSLIWRRSLGGNTLGGWYTLALQGKMISPSNTTEKANALCDKYTILSINDLHSASHGLSVEVGGIISVYDTDYTDVDADIFTNSLNGVLFYYQLAKPIYTPIDEPMQLAYKVDDFGTERIISDLPSTPFKADIVYQFNAEGRIRDNSRNIEKLENNINNVQDKLDSKQDTLISGTNIKFINGESVLGEGNLVIDGNNIFVGNDLANEAQYLNTTIKQYGELIESKYVKSETGIPTTDLSEEVQTSLGKADNSVRLTTGGGDINPGYNGDKQFYIQKVNGVPTLKIEMLTKSDVLSGKYTGNNGNSPFVGADIVWDLYNDVYDLADSKYTKPEEGISITDLEEYVQEAVSKAHVSVAKSDLYYEVISFTIDDINNCIKNGDTEFTIDNEPNNNNFRNGKPLMIKKNADSEALYPLTYTKQGNTISMNYSGTISCVVEGVTYEFDISYVAINSAATISNIKRYYNDYHVLSFTLEDLDNISTSPIEINVTELFRVIRSNQPIIIKNSIDDSDRGGFLVSGLSELADDGETLYINLNIFALTNLWKINNLALDNTDRSEQTYTLTSSNITKYSLPNLSRGSASLIAKSNLKTINGTSIFKEHNVSGNIYTYYPISPVTVVGTADRAASYMLSPNILYNWGDYIPINISIVLGRPYENVVNEYVLQFKTTDTVPTVVFPSSVKWVSGNAPVLEENKIYQISIINNLGTVLSWDNA